MQQSNVNRHSSIKGGSWDILGYIYGEEEFVLSGFQALNLLGWFEYVESCVEKYH
jgi:hypothetical protein